MTLHQTSTLYEPAVTFTFMESTLRLFVVESHEAFAELKLSVHDLAFAEVNVAARRPESTRTTLRW